MSRIETIKPDAANDFNSGRRLMPPDGERKGIGRAGSGVRTPRHGGLHIEFPDGHHVVLQPGRRLATPKRMSAEEQALRFRMNICDEVEWYMSSVKNPGHRENVDQHIAFASDFGVFRNICRQKELKPLYALIDTQRFMEDTTYCDACLQDEQISEILKSAVGATKNILRAQLKALQNPATSAPVQTPA